MLTNIIRKTRSDRGSHSKAFCKCWNKRTAVTWEHLRTCCCCGEDFDVTEWKLQHPLENQVTSWAVVSEDRKLVTFHPFYSCGTAVVKGDTPLVHNYQYYWEIKMLTETYGTDIMIGLGTSKIDVAEALTKFTSLLGQDGESYGLSYSGAVRHDGSVARDTVGFCLGTIVGVRVDMWHGTLEFYLNRKPQGISFYNLRRHQQLFPMMCSTAAQSSMRLIYASSWQASLLVDAARILAASVTKEQRPRVPPGLWNRLQEQFWLTLPVAGSTLDEEEKDNDMEPTAPSMPVGGVKRRHWETVAAAGGVRVPDDS